LLDQPPWCFVPAAEIAGDWTVPGDGRTLAELARHFGDAPSVRMVGPPRRWL
jgi:hypothetical protein